MCGAPLTRGARVLVCPKRHSLDVYKRQAKVQEAYEAKLEPVLPYRTAEAAGPAQEAPALKYAALNLSLIHI